MIETQKPTVISNDSSIVCAKCSERILNVMTTDEQDIYHPHCFSCSDCGRTLAGVFFYKSKLIKADQPRYNFVESIRFCEICYKKIASKWYVE